jgi:hypothetical protein
MAITQAGFFIDASTGDDKNDGATPATALRTHAELERRIDAGGNLLSPPISAGQKITTVNILTDLPDTDPINLDGVVLGEDVLLHYKGGIASTDRSGTFTDVVAMDPANNQPFEVEDTDMPSVWMDDLGRRVRITSGARENVVMWVAKDLGATGLASRILQPARHWSAPSPTTTASMSTRKSRRRGITMRSRRFEKCPSAWSM